MTDDKTHAKQVNELAERANIWLDTATAAELWEVLQHGGIDARVGLPGVDRGLGYLTGPGPTFLDELRSRDWAPSPEVQDLAAWFLADLTAQQCATSEIRASITELFFNLGEWEWVDGKPWGEEPLKADNDVRPR